MEPCNQEEANTNVVEEANTNEEPGNSKVPSRRPKGTGRKKIEILQKIENNASRKVAFTKRRKGLFKKTEEICKLCEAEIAIIVFSNKGRLFSYGYPSVQHVVNRLLNEKRDEPAEEKKETEMKTEENQCVISREGGGEFWFDESLESLDMRELEQFVDHLERLILNFCMKKEELVMRRNSEIDFFGRSAT